MKDVAMNPSDYTCSGTWHMGHTFLQCNIINFPGTVMLTERKQHQNLESVSWQFIILV